MWKHEIIEALKSYIPKDYKEKEGLIIIKNEIQKAIEFHVNNFKNINLFNKNDFILIDNWWRPPFKNIALSFQENNCSYFIHMNENTNIEGLGCECNYFISLFFKRDNDEWDSNPCSALVPKINGKFKYFLMYDGETFTPDDPKANCPNIFKKYAWYSIQSLCMLFRFLNAKGIEIKEILPNPDKNKKLIKRGKCPKFSYKILTIKKNIKRVKYMEAPENLKSRPIRFHAVRGHSKTYTEKAPMFGWYVGDIFVPDFFKGNKEIGSIEKDYII